MAEDQEPNGPSLEPPSLFKRRRKLVAPQLPPPDDSPTTILDDVAPAPEPTVALGSPAPAPPPVFADEASADAAAALPTPPEPTSVPASAPAPAPVRRTRRAEPVVPGRVAAAVTGLVVGAAIVGLTTASFRLCEKVQGTNSCGGPGIFLLVAILVVAVVLGTLLLRLLKVPEPGSTSFLAVGLTSVIALLFLVDSIFEWWMFIAVPLVSVATYLLSHWVTTTFVEPEREVGLAAEPEIVDHDVR